MKAEKTVILLLFLTFVIGFFTSIFIYNFSTYEDWVNKTNKKYYPQITWEREWKKD